MQGSHFQKTVAITTWRIIGVIANLVLPIYLSRNLGIHLYSTYKFFFLIYGILLIILPMGLDSSLLYFIAKDRSRHHIYSLNTMIASGVATVLVCWLLSYFSFSIGKIFDQPEFAHIMPSFSLFLISSAMIYHISVYLIYLGRESLAIVYEIFSQILKAIIITSSFLFTNSLSNVFLNLTLQNLIILFIFTVKHLKRTKEFEINGREILNIGYSQMKFGLPIAASQVVFF